MTLQGIYYGLFQVQVLEIKNWRYFYEKNKVRAISPDNDCCPFSYASGHVHRQSRTMKVCNKVQRKY